MKAWRVVLLTLSFLLLGGCLVTFDEPLPVNQAAPKALLGQWSSKDAWGQPLKLSISRAGGNTYKAVAHAQGKAPEEYAFTVARHGNRWYLSAGVPKRLGGRFLIGGFEVVDGKQLVVYNLDVEQVQQALDKKELSGRSTEVPEDNGPGVLIDSPSERVLAYLDDPANSDLFVEVARFERVAK
ncbi:MULTISPECIES: outer membrane lipoprotein carrier protein LolA [Pseudomonas]|uniref:outer membrane lipoprotein carrier protein LolA n=1 Tax=Pseudomonas TaxID=286 RepID=UPI001F020815|nr:MULTISPECIES: outer membrane lipoprotein carrier protein LolA [Pseudomonas]MCG8293534.1 outer membrane lipoprotein carrier protein LolA [Pseudomonas entomophila]